MAKHDVIDGTETFERLGNICDQLVAMGYDKTAEAIAGHVRERRGRLQAATSIPFELGRHLIALADEAEVLIGVIRSRSSRRQSAEAIEVARRRGS